MKKLMTMVVMLALATAAFADDLDFTALRFLAVQKDGRKKPLDTVALETVEKLTGKKTFLDPESGRTMEPMDVMLSMWLDTRDWSKVPVILVNYGPLREKLGLPIDQKFFTYSQVSTPKFQEMTRRIEEKESGKQKTDLTHEEREASILEQRLQTLSEAVGPEALAVVPHPSEKKGAWLPVTQVARYYGADKAAELQKTFQALAAAYVQRDPSAFAATSGQLHSLLASLSPAVYPNFTDLQREVHYNSFHPFRKAMLLYVVAFIITVATWRVRGEGWYWVGFAAFAAGVVVHGYAFYLRMMISGRAPVTNMYESVVWVSFGAAMFALLLEAISRQRYYIAGAVPLSILLLLLADQFPAVLDPSIGPLTPVLRNNWLIWVHVPTITLGYAAFAVAMGVGHIALGYYIFAPREKQTIAKVENFVYRAMQIGVLLLAAGTILGGIWAHYAWGRFWGWDPKETWACIALVSYLIPLHGRLAGWLSNFALSVASVVCFLSVLMAWYGVNFVLGKGLHSYGFGVGGFSYVIGFVAVELALVGFATWRRSTANAARSLDAATAQELAVK